MRYLVFAPLLFLSGCVTIPREYRYYSHQIKGMMQLPMDREMCARMLAEQEKAEGKYVFGKIDWEKVDRCLNEFGWKRMQ